MALQSQAQLLDELMGKNRNAGPGIRINSVRFDDEDVCKYSLCGFCPHDLFVNTRADLGPCDKIHDEELANAYEKSSRCGKLGYEEEFERFIRGLLADVEKKIRRGVERLRLTQNDPNHKTPSQLRGEKIASLKEQVNAIIKEAEILGEAGEIDQAQAKLESCEKLKSECKYLEIQAEQQAMLIDQKIMEVCETCGSFLIVNDAQARVEEHVAGKQHMGYAKLRAALENIRKKRMEEVEKREKERQARREEMSREREKERGERNGDREKEKGERNRDSNHPVLERNGDREKERGDRNGDREKEKGDRNGDREKEKGDRNGDREKERGDRNGDREKEKGDRNGNREKEKGDRNGDRHKVDRQRDRDRDRERSDRDRDRERDRERGDRERNGLDKSRSSAGSGRRGSDRTRSERSRSRDRKRSHRSTSRSRDAKVRRTGTGEENGVPSIEKVKEEGERDSELDEGEIQ